MVKSGETESFPATMILYGKPIFTTFQDFHKIIFQQGETDEPRT
jgi:hypothetical protein